MANHNQHAPKHPLPPMIPTAFSIAPAMVAAVGMESAKRTKLSGTPSSIGSTPSALSSNAQTGGNKGLRHFSEKVAKKVEEKGHTTYQEVADELVKEYIAENKGRKDGDPSPHKKVEHKNIRRRVYDALNVLMAMDIISKDKKDIFWQGLPEYKSGDLEMLQREKDNRAEEVAKKRELLLSLLKQEVLYRNLVKRNRENEKMSSSKRSKDNGGKVALPFCVISSSDDTEIEFEMGQRDVSLQFSGKFHVKDDKEIISNMGFDKTTYEELKLMLPRDLLTYCEEHDLLKSLVKDETPTLTKVRTSVIKSPNGLDALAKATVVFPFSAFPICK
mmetsp:Transcript_27733/g.43017  ORF Transcript_27733/g.43017 Transcript_27733/m.43017 type:complete len:331 (-) Transcript_27733:231-1223(-)|eukprot:CAMPEP_0196824262 /NCGR_PEP_ID=MMETSP1362-20130617/91101_1 /TAXON_ID=163516 /ORGANISM="Leptocylindrus danicus, Strain CCMP1856" /LENGTH=330 /DNA_ID=CAMNT_0042204457 /DNA_START=211 /DNA_END=1203 /DNA_ORIENTATION=+